MEKKFSEQESLDVINGMIAQARGRIRKGDGSIMMLWGYVVALTSLAHFLLSWFGVEYTENFNPNHLWLIGSSVGVIATIVIILANRRKSLVKTYAGSIGGGVWAGFCVCVVFISFLLGGRYPALIYPVISLVYTYGLFMTAKTFRFKWLYLNVAVCALLVLCYKFVPGLYFPLLMTAIMLAGNIIPGHIINAKGRRNV